MPLVTGSGWKPPVGVTGSGGGDGGGAGAATAQHKHGWIPPHASHCPEATFPSLSGPQNLSPPSLILYEHQGGSTEPIYDPVTVDVTLTLGN